MISRFQSVIFTICVFIIICDGFATQAVAWVAPSIASGWKLAPGSFGVTSESRCALDQIMNS